MTRRWRFLLLAVCALFLQGVLAEAHAEPPKRGRARVSAAGAKKTRGKPKKESKRSSGASERKEVAAHKESEKGEKGEAESGSKSVNDAQKLARDAAQGANAEIVKEGDTSVKVMKFSGLDIEGRLKSPQLLYFVSRVHAEFDRPKLPHRSFMPELQESTEREPLR